jgi:hypothetical protein
MIKNTITIFLPIDHFTDFNQYLEQLHQVANQAFDENWTLEVITITTEQVPKEVREIYENLEDIKSRFSSWPQNVILKYFFSDDHSYNKIRNYIENEAKFQIGELSTIKSIAPIVWLPNHIQCHIEEYSSHKKKCGWMLSRLEIKNIPYADDEKKNTLHFRLEDFPDHIDKIVPDEIFMVHSVAVATDFNKAAVVTEENGMRTAIFHAGRLLMDEIKANADRMGLEGFNPKEFSIQQWIDYEAILRRQEEMKKEESGGVTTRNEDGSVTFIEKDEDGSITFTEEG